MIFVFTVAQVGHIDEQLVFIGDCMPSSEEFIAQIKTIKIPDLVEKYYRPMRHAMNNLLMTNSPKPRASCSLDGGKLLMVKAFKEEDCPGTRMSETQSFAKP